MVWTNFPCLFFWFFRNTSRFFGEQVAYFSNMKIISCVRFELDFRGQIFTRRRSIAVVMWLKREEIWTEKIFKDDADYFFEDYLSHPTPLFSPLPFPFLPFSSFFASRRGQKKREKGVSCGFFRNFAQKLSFCAKEAPQRGVKERIFYLLYISFI